MSIPDEAVEAAARAFYLESSPLEWEHLTNKVTRENYRQAARAALEAAAPILLKNMRPMSLVEIEERDNPELMKAARKRVRDQARADRAAHAREIKAAAWDEGFFDGKRQDAEGDDGPKFTNPYRENPDG